jgi:hypothetical protein
MEDESKMDEKDWSRAERYYCLAADLVPEGERTLRVPKARLLAACAQPDTRFSPNKHPVLSSGALQRPMPQCCLFELCA